MPIRAALATSDDQTINEHFGKTSSFSVYELRIGSIRFLERRAVVPLSETSGGHEAGLGATLEALRDCRIIAAARIGGAVRRQLALTDVAAYSSEESIVDFLNAITASRLYAKHLR